MPARTITVTLILDPDLFRLQRQFLINLQVPDADKEHLEGLIALTDHIADVAVDQYDMKEVLLTDATLDKPKLPTLDVLLDAIKQVETGGNPNAVGDGGKSQGAYQIGWAYTEDARQQIAKEHGPTPPQYSDIVHDDQWCREIIKAYWRRYCPTYYDDIISPPNNLRLVAALQVLARTHNGGGPSGSIKSATIPYWNKVKAVLVSRGFTL